MADRPIIFSGPMVRALLEGRKTQTRRIIKPQPELNGAGLWVWPPYAAKISKRTWRGFCQTDKDGLKNFFDGPGKAQEALPAKVGDRLWVKETVGWLSRIGTVYRADGRELDDYIEDGSLKWKPSIFCPRAASRLTLTVTEVRVQRLQEIDHLDAEQEGVKCDMSPRTFVDHFRILWETIHGPGSWEANPWIAAISFAVGQRNIDAETK
jgi:hypothetical protein